jgi:hypothetical protein|tara:strand:- start:52860 stop:53402 length:543 start_codon:yes stop_codon:yes gene_type:complete
VLSFLTKRKISEEKLAECFTAGILQLVDSGFPEVAQLINEDPEFEIAPAISANAADKFLLIVIAGNLAYVPKLFNSYQDIRLMEGIYNKLSTALNIDKEKLRQLVASYQSYMNRINMPSKNIHYGMSKAVFFKYELNQYQDAYFRKMNAPNPLFLKRMDDIVEHFIWNWEEIKAKYKLVE